MEPEQYNEGMSVPAALILAYATLMLGYFMGWIANDLYKGR